MALLDALQARKSQRSFLPDPLTDQQLSDLLWAAFGINRPANEHRTAPSAMNSQELEIYLVRADGAYVYRPKTHDLLRIATGDLRSGVNGQAYVKEAALALVYVADLPKLAKAKPEEREFYAAVDTGFVGQNTYLYCASEGLATVVWAIGDRKAVSATLRLRPDQVPILGQSVGRSSGKD